MPPTLVRSSAPVFVCFCLKGHANDRRRRRKNNKAPHSHGVTNNNNKTETNRLNPDLAKRLPIFVNFQTTLLETEERATVEQKTMKRELICLNY